MIDKAAVKSFFYVADGGDATGPALLEERQKKLVGAADDREAGKGMGIADHVAEIAGTVLHAGDGVGILFEQPFDQIRAEGDPRHLREVIEVHLQPRVAHLLDDFGKPGEQAIVADVLVVERRQHQHAARAQFHGLAGQPDGVRDRAASGPRHQRIAGNAVFDEVVEKPQAFVHGKRVRLAGGAQNREAVASVVEKPAAVRRQRRPVRSQRRIQRRQNRRHYTSKGFIHGLSSSVPKPLRPAR